MKDVLFLTLALLMGGCAASTGDEKSSGDMSPENEAPSNQDAGTCLAGEDCGNDTPFDEDDAAGGTCLAGEECGNDTPFEDGEDGDADPFATCLAGEECGNDTPGDLEGPTP